ncbi:related to THI21-Hydroxymethylpyrimidine phosphate kinase, involved in the last steps in thiamine biosynthesis [Sporisorium reilianum f. sp. reilianum]|uniref:Related to THI21-Hydroxymethylpyrimidine phosphate kinase, involved in the last steps in thiamine biosynthesis n=1 Tax=Sporisorium reilianum f. sp. reilianum TaxID=72559 RepID=A0A2N8UGC8_9BASI|nr:related to THI21-Hydroxymethylpyrimidine phosphate kinase, involved in the last steps in thiamine biosynthesis [Sporisorium reilianum f. sp. reilianum]
MSPPRVLTIAGSDSGGGAGIQADLKTFLSLGTYGLSVLTALTAQNTTGVSAIHACPPEFVLQQLDSVVSDIQVDAIKMGMLCNHEIVAALATRLREWKASADSHGGSGVPIVLDPVMVSTSGSLLLSEGAIETLIRDLLPLCTILTPNLPEARQLLNYAAKFTSHQSGPRELELAQNNEDTELPQMMAAAKSIAKLGPPAVLVKGGHAKLSRSQIDTWLQSIDCGPKGPQQISPATRISTASTSIERYPHRSDLRRKTSSSTPVDVEDDLKQLAGVDGAIITQRGNVTVIHTDQIPFSEVLHPHAAQSGDDKVVCDVLFQQTDDAEGSYVLFVKPLLDSKATHGTGCTLSSALAASLAQGHSLLRSTSIAIKYVQHAIANGIQDLGKGPGPLDHSYPFQPRGLILSGNTASQLFPLNQSLLSNSIQEWTAFVQHPFVLGLADGSLPREAFEWFMKQDYLFLRHYARIWAQAAAAPDNTFEEVSTLAEMAQAMAEEAKLHLRLCQDSFGISAHELEHGTMESAATLAYTRFVLDTARSSDSLDLLVAVSPCMVGYAQVGLWLAQHRKEGIDKDYAAWIEAYSSHEFQSVVQRAMRLVEAKAAKDAPSPHRLGQLQRTWNAACRLEAGMWDEAVDASLRRLVLEP